MMAGTRSPTAQPTREAGLITENGDGTFFFPATKGQPRTSMCCQWKNGSPTTAKARLELDDGTVLAGKVAVARFRELERSCSRAEVRPCGRLRSVA